MTHCDLCRRPCHDTAYVCTPCAGHVAKLLTAAAELYPELQLAIARLVRYNEPTRLSAPEPPLPFSVDAAIDHGAVVNTITTWARHVAAEQGVNPAGRNPMLFLAEHRQVEWLRHRPEAAEAFDELEYAARLTVRAVDAPAQYWFAGTCLHEGCPAELYGRAGAPNIRCRGCGYTHDADGRRAWLLGQARDFLASATEIARFVSAMRRERVSAAMVRGYAHRGRIVAHGADGDGHPRYRVGDVLDTLERIAA